MICGWIYKHPSMKISRFNSEYLTPLLTNIKKEEKTCMLMGDFNINLLNAKQTPIYQSSMTICHHISLLLTSFNQQD